LQMSNQVWVDKLTEALILALLEQSKTHNGWQ
jgi:hypothetical protein